MQICITDISQYSIGNLRFQWFDLYDYEDVDALNQAIKTWLKEYESEEWGVEDTSGTCGLFTQNLDKYFQLRDLLNGDADYDAVEGFIKIQGKDCNLDEFEDYYIGCYNSEEEFAKEYNQSLIQEYQLSELKIGYQTIDELIDWEAVANDYFINDFNSHIAIDGCYVYRK